MGDVNVVIDGSPVSCEDGMTILEAAGRAGITIPTLCQQDGLKPSGNCRICVVEVKGFNRLVGSCHTPVQNGMEIWTRSSRVLEARAATVELLLAAHTGHCVKDEAASECALHRLASELEAGPPRFRIRRPRSYLPETSPYLLRDLSKCVLCRKCVRACREIAGRTFLSVAYRGFESKIVVDCDVALEKEECRQCGVCIEYCPTSALMAPEKAPGVTVEQAPTAVSPKPETGPDKEKLSRLHAMLDDEQTKSGYLSRESMEDIAGALGLPLSDVYATATFYSFLSVEPLGKNVIRICKSLPCYMKNAPMIVANIEKEIGIKPGETTPDGKFSFELTNCIGACDQAPAMLINDEVCGNLTPEKIAGILSSHK